MSNIICCDWGSSRFRLYLFDTITRLIVKQFNSYDGILKINDQWDVIDKSSKIAKSTYFLTYLFSQCEKLLGKPCFDLNIYVSGMASSTIGFHYVDYSDIPLDLDKNIPTVYKIFDKKNNCTIHIISGIRDNLEVVRGEEVQMLGLYEIYPNAFNIAMANVIFPGTHSKHFFIKNNQITSLKTYMTGELFHLMAHHSILKSSIKLPYSEMTTIESEIFRSGVMDSVDKNLFNKFFEVRTRSISNQYSDLENYYYLSGLCIGYELRELKYLENTIFICAAYPLFKFYKAGIQELNLGDKTRFIAPEIVENLVVYGHLRIFKNGN